MATNTHSDEEQPPTRFYRLANRGGQRWTEDARDEAKEPRANGCTEIAQSHHSQ